MREGLLFALCSELFSITNLNRLPRGPVINTHIIDNLKWDGGNCFRISEWVLPRINSLNTRLRFSNSEHVWPWFWESSKINFVHSSPPLRRSIHVNWKKKIRFWKRKYRSFASIGFNKMSVDFRSSHEKNEECRPTFFYRFLVLGFFALIN